MSRNASVVGADRIRYFEEFIMAAADTPLEPGAGAKSGTSTNNSVAPVASALNGEYSLLHSSDSEAQTQRFTFADQLVIDPTKQPVFECRLKRVSAAPSADQRVVVGLAAARNATLDSNAAHCWFRMEGANQNILIEGDDGATDTDDEDSDIDWATGVYQTFVVDMTDLSNVKFTVDGIDAGSVNVAAMGASNKLQPYVEIQRDAGAEVDAVTLDYIAYEQNR